MGVVRHWNRLSGTVWIPRTNTDLSQLLGMHKAGRNVLITIAMTIDKLNIDAVSGERHQRPHMRT